MTKAYAIVLLAVGTAVLLGCVSTQGKASSFESVPQVNGMIYDYDNRPVAHAEIAINGEKLAVSDINGRFILNGLQYGDYELAVVANGYEGKTLKVYYSEPTQILYLKLHSVTQIVAIAEKALENREWESAREQLDRALRVNPRDESVRFLRAVLHFRTGDSEAARSLLEALIADGVRDPYINLFLADIYQYHLDRKPDALVRLDSFLLSRYDPDVQRRRNNLAEELAAGENRR